MYRTGEAIGGTFGVSDPDTAGLVAPDALPTAELRINGVVSAAAVTVAATATTGKYTWSVTLPTIVDGTVLEIWVSAVVGEVPAGGVVWSGVGCTIRPVDVASEVWSAASRTLTQTAAQVVSAVSGSHLTIEQGYDFDVTLTGLTIPEFSKLWFSVKANRGDADSDAWLHLEGTPSTSLLKYVYGATVTTATNGTLTIDRVAGTIRVQVKAAETLKIVIANRQLVYDVKVLATSGALDKLTEGSARSLLGITLDVD